MGGDDRHPRRRPAIPTIVAALVVGVAGAGASQEPAPGRSKDDPANGRVRRDPPGFYMGRPIADVMSWEGADWLFRETRIEEEQPEAMLNALKIPKGATVADVGAG